MKTPGTRMLILFLLQILWSKTAGSAALTNSNIDEEC